MKAITRIALALVSMYMLTSQPVAAKIITLTDSGIVGSSALILPTNPLAPAPFTFGAMSLSGLRYQRTFVVDTLTPGANTSPTRIWSGTAGLGSPDGGSIPTTTPAVINYSIEINGFTFAGSGTSRGGIYQRAGGSKSLIFESIASISTSVGQSDSTQFDLPDADGIDVLHGDFPIPMTFSSASFHSATNTGQILNFLPGANSYGYYGIFYSLSPDTFTVQTTTAVPEPTSAMLFIIGLIGLAGIRRIGGLNS